MQVTDVLILCYAKYIIIILFIYLLLVLSNCKIQYFFATIISVGAMVYTAAILEYLCAEVLELAGNAANDLKKKRIIPRHILLAVR